MPGIWVKSSSGTAFDVKNVRVKTSGGVEHLVKAGWYKDSGGVVRQFWPANDPETFSYYANWSQSYKSSTANNSSNRDVLAYEGQSDFHGNEGALFGFDDALMRSNLSGRTITAVSLRLSQRWSYAGSGKEFHVCEHNHSTEPSTASFGSTLATPFLARGQILTFSLPNSFGEALRDGTERGVGLKYTTTDWGYIAGMKTTTVLTASPSAGGLITCPTSELALLQVSVA